MRNRLFLLIPVLLLSLSACNTKEQKEDSSSESISTIESFSSEEQTSEETSSSEEEASEESSSESTSESDSTSENTSSEQSSSESSSSEVSSSEETSSESSSSSESGKPYSGNFDDVDGYYDFTIVSPSRLFSDLRTTINHDYHTIGYDGLKAAYAEVDVRDDGYIQDIYSDNTNYTLSDAYKNYSKEGDSWNREHTIPQSWWGKGTSNQGCDIFIVYPSDGYVNGKRSNYPFGEVDSATYESHGGFCKLGTSSFAGYNGTVFEPNDRWKGDMARVYFYALTKWSGAYNWTKDNGGTVVFSGNQNVNHGLTNYALNLFLKWHHDDPVDEWERGRNDRAYKHQNNRNPYIDNPDWVDYIWGK